MDLFVSCSLSKNILGMSTNILLCAGLTQRRSDTFQGLKTVSLETSYGQDLNGFGAEEVGS